MQYICITSSPRIANIESPQLESQKPVEFVCSGREDQDGNPLRPLIVPEEPAQLGALHAGQQRSRRMAPGSLSWTLEWASRR